MAAARPTPDGAPSPRVDGGPARGARLTTRRGDGGSDAAAAGSGLPAGGSGASTPELAGASRSQARRLAVAGGWRQLVEEAGVRDDGRWRRRLAATGRGGGRRRRPRWRRQRRTRWRRQRRPARGGRSGGRNRGWHAREARPRKACGQPGVAAACGCISGVGAGLDGAKGTGGGGSSSSLPIGTLTLSRAHPPLCEDGEAQAAEAMLPSPGFSFGQIWRGGRRVVERRGPGPALRDGGSRKSADGGASVRCGGSLVIGRTES
uniref:Uncharacterized protein n=1 Tax=Oryza rufipogon TaxID=4529 RepID=A0A0E0NK04_ORYRU